MSTLWRLKIFIKWIMTSKVMQRQDHLFAKIILAHSFMDRFWWKFVWMLIPWRHNIWPEMSILCYEEVLCFYTSRSNQNLDLRSYGQLCPCLLFTWVSNLWDEETVCWQIKREQLRDPTKIKQYISSCETQLK